MADTLRRFRFPISGYMEIDATDLQAAASLLSKEGGAAAQVFTDHRKEHNAFCYAVGIGDESKACEIDRRTGAEICTASHCCNGQHLCGRIPPSVVGSL